MYVGKAKNLKERVSSYFTNQGHLGEKTRILLSKTEKVKATVVQSEIESLLLEANYIKKYRPFYNIRLTDGKAYPLIRITIKDKYPKVLISRRMDDAASLYFGPYPNTKAMRLVLRTIRRIFPFQSVVNHPKKPCLYYHLGLCPCPNVFACEELEKTYRKNINQISKFLNGKINKVLGDLKEEREMLSQNENFEKARNIQKKIESIELILNPIFKPFEYETNPNLTLDLRIKELKTLKEELSKNEVFVAVLKRIEGYDVSNIQGSFAAGVMVVFLNGEKDPPSYRRFRIKNQNQKGRQNDFAMMEEIITRRLKHKEWQFPDLIVVDGGKGQVGSAVKALKKYNLVIPVIGLAKRQELIITSNFKEVRLTKRSAALMFLMRIRDEAHRFAISYHRKLRSKSTLRVEPLNRNFSLR